jgi:hypothetical protein
LENVKAFRWWGGSVNKEQLGKDVSIVARFGDIEESPAIAERAFGKGRVVAFAVPADADWHNWPTDPSYLLIVQDFVRYLASSRGSSGLVTVGEPIRQAIDLTNYELDAALSGPRELKVNLQATSAPQSKAEPPSEAAWQVEHPSADAQGFYELSLTRRDGATDTLLFAANIDPSEGDLKRVDRAELARELAGTNVQLVAMARGGWLSDSGTQTEVWWYLLWALVAVLFGEQVLGWFFGRGRS